MSIPAGQVGGAAAAPETDVDQIGSQRQSHWRRLLLLTVLLGGYYALLQNGRWWVGSDSELYLALGRNLANGGDFTFMGAPLARISPGWPYVMAGLLKISDSFWLINGFCAACMLAAALMWYGVLRRMITPSRAFWVVLLTGTLFPWYRLTFLAFTEGLFCLLATGALLLAMQIREGRPILWRLPLMLFCCAAMVSVRWAGVVSWMLVAGALIRGDSLRVLYDPLVDAPGWKKRWLVMLLTGLVTVGAFWQLRKALQYRADNYVPPPTQRVLGVPTDNAPPLAGLKSSWTLGVSEEQAQKAGGKYAQYLNNLANSGNWISEMLWEPSEFSTVSPLLHVGVNLVGWFLLICIGLYIWPRIQKGDWLWLAMALYCATLFLRWGRPVSRYLIPSAPMIVAAAWLGMEGLRTVINRPWAPRLARLTTGAFLASVVVVNLGIYSIDVWVARSGQFYQRYFAGQTGDMIAVAQYLKERNVGGGEVAVNYYCTSFGKVIRSSRSLRMLYVLIDQPVRMPSKRTLPGDAPTPQLLGWAKKNGVKYYVRTAPVDPWRLYHFRAGWLQKWMTGQDPAPLGPFFELYDLTGESVARVDVPPSPLQITRVPGVR